MDDTNHERLHLDNQNRELNNLLQKKQEVVFAMQALEKNVSLYASRDESLRRSWEESQKVAAETEEAARVQAAAILAEAEVAAEAKRKQLALIQQEIIRLQSELEEGGEEKNVSPRAAVSSPPCTASTPRDSFQPRYGDASSQPEPALTFVEKDRNRYSMRLIRFVNARHFISLGGVAGSVHAHSWQVDAEVSVVHTTEDTLEFSQVSRAIATALDPYENTLLNQVYPFNIIQPTTENIAMYFFNRLDEILIKLGLELSQLHLWESPTRGIHVNYHNHLLDEQIAAYSKTLAGALHTEEAAASREDNYPGCELPLDNQPELPSSPSPSPPVPVSAGSLKGPYSLRQYMLATVLILLFAFIAYHNILWPPTEQRFPWGSDSWGHLFKAEMLYEQIRQGNYYPQFTEYWYNGTQPFRYWAPLPYYALAGLNGLSGDIFVAGNLYIFLCALLGALSWLLLSRRMGLWPAVMAALIWLIWQDNVRVAFSEGNLPRVLATALLPLLFALFLRVVTQKKPYGAIIATILTVHLVLLCHAMIAAVYCICLSLFALFLWIFQGCNIRDFNRGILALLAGILSAAWWLLPSLSGGIAGIDAQAVKEIVQFVPAQTSLSPLYRFKNIEAFYWGISLVVLLISSIITWKSKSAWAKSLIVCGTILLFITFPLFRAIYITLPLSHLLWPLRFSSFAALALLAAGLSFEIPQKRQPWLHSPALAGIILVLLFSTLLIDCIISFRLLAHTGNRPFTIIQSSNYIKQEPGWRVASIDLSRLGSPPSYTFSETAGLEQVFGWAWQGAVTARNIMLLNTGIEEQYYPFLFRSCVDLGATDLVVKDDVITDLPAFRRAADKAGYQQKNKFADISIWKSLDRPYLVEKNIRCLVIGKYAGTIALQFPEVEMALSPYVDEYPLEKLEQYSMLILSGANWRSKKQAEKLISDYAAAGGQVFIEMAGMPLNVLAKQPEFLGVYGEAVNIRQDVEVWGNNTELVLSPLHLAQGEWKAYVPMGLDEVELEFSYYGNQAPILGYKMINQQKIWFLGANLSYYAFKTGNSDGARLLKDIFNLETEYAKDKTIPFTSYAADEKGYRISYDLQQDTEVVLPISFLDGMVVKLNNKIIAPENYENLLKLRLPKGSHRLEISIEKTPIYTWGTVVSLLVILLIAICLFWLKRAGEQQ